MRMMMTITGPSCSGKTTLLNQLVAENPSLFAKLPSVTTRERRAGEADGDEYYFIDETLFAELEQGGCLLQTVNYNGCHYGTRATDLEAIFERGLIPLRVVEPSGVGQFEAAGARMGFEVVSIFLSDDVEILTERWLRRVADLVREGGRPDLRFYAERMLVTLGDEQTWIDRRLYDFYCTEDYRQPELVVALTRLARGLTTLAVLRRLFTRPRVPHRRLLA